MMNHESLIKHQQEICERLGSEYSSCDFTLKVGVSRNVRSGMLPLNGLRIAPTDGTCGWYIWAGEEWSDDADFFVPLHAEHLLEWAPRVLPYLGLAPGWRFLLADGYEDVWADPQLML